MNDAPSGSATFWQATWKFAIGLLTSIDTIAVALWAFRAFFLCFVVGGWLLYAYTLERWRFAEELRTRGETTVAKDARKLLDPIRLNSLGNRIQEYYYQVDGVTYRHSTTRREDVAGQTVTYLPEDPDAHQVGTIEPQFSTLKDVLILLVVFALYAFFPLVFFATCVTSPKGHEQNGGPTVRGVGVIVGLAVLQAAVVFTALSVQRLPFTVVLNQYVPAFVGGTVAVVVAVRLASWAWGIDLCSPAAVPKRPAACHEPVEPAGTGAGGDENAANKAEPAVQEEQAQVEPKPADPRAGAGPLLTCPVCASAISGVSDASGMLTCPSGHSFDASEEAAASQRPRDPPPPAPLPWYDSPLAALSGASGCLLVAALSSVAVHLLKGGWPVPVDLIIGAIAATFGAIRGVRHARGVWHAGLDGRTYREIAWMAAEDLGFLAHPGTFEWEKFVTLILAVVLALPLIAVLLVLWFVLPVILALPLIAVLLVLWLVLLALLALANEA